MMRVMVVPMFSWVSHNIFPDKYFSTVCLADDNPNPQFCVLFSLSIFFEE